MFIVQKMNKGNGFWEKLNLSFCTETAKMEGSAEYNSSSEEETTWPIKSVLVSSKKKEIIYLICYNVKPKLSLCR